MADNIALSTFSRLNLSDFTSLLLFGLSLLTLQFENGLSGLNILFRNRLLFFPADVIRLDLFTGGQIGNLLDTLGIEDVVLIQFFKGRLLKVVNRGIIQTVTIQVGSDDLEDFFLKSLTRVVKFNKVKLLADRFQSFRKLGVKKLDKRGLLRCSFGAQGLSHQRDIPGRFIHSNKKRDLDVRADIVFTDQALFALSENLDTLDRDLHAFPEVNHGKNKHATETCLRSANSIADDRFALLNLFVKLSGNAQQADHNNHQTNKPPQ